MNFFANTLTWWQWALLAAVPPAIVLLYFLKLKRMPLEVPSTYLWSRTIEDLHVNSIWQRLRQSLLLFLQLLLVFLVMLACLRPGWQGAELVGERFIFLIDTSASMSANDMSPSRLATAKSQVEHLIEQMRYGDAAMIISFSDAARVEQSFTGNRGTLRRKLARIEPTNRTSDLSEALRAASGLANPGRTSQAEDLNDIQVADAMPATLYIFSDGGFRNVPDFSLGNLDPIYVPIGRESAENVGVVAFSVDRNAEKLDQFQAFARLENFGSDDVTVEAALYVGDQLRDAELVEVPGEGGAGVQFELGGSDLDDAEQGTLRLEISDKHKLLLDNAAYAAVNAPRPARVLLVTPQNDALKLALQTEEAVKLATVKFAEPAILETEAHQQEVLTGAYDVIVYDQCTPKKMPQANTLFIGRLPPLDNWSAGEKQGPPLIIDVDRAHPLTQLIELGNVRIVEGFAVNAPQGSAVLIDSDIGSLLSIAPREGFEDAVLGFEIVSRDEDGEVGVNTDWPIRLSFPVFIRNVLEYLGGTNSGAQAATIQPGRPVALRTTSVVKQVEVESPTGKKTRIARDAQNAFLFSDTEELGIYSVREGTAGSVSQRFAVNLFDSRESNLKPSQEIAIGHEDVQAMAGWEPARKELWKWILLIGLAVLVFEWYVYNRRVYL